GRCQVSDFVEQDRAPVRQLEQTLPTLVSVGDRAVFVSEQLRLEERGREPAAMHLDKGAVSTRGEVMDRAGHPAFPGAALAREQHRRPLARCEQLHLVPELAGCGRDPERFESLVPVLAPAQQGVDRKSTRLNSSHDQISYAVFCLKKKKK